MSNGTPAPVIVNLQVAGVREVQEALRSVEQSIERMEKRTGQLSSDNSRRKVRNVQDAMQVAEAASKRVAAAESAAARVSTREADRAAKAKIRADEQVAKALERNSQREIKAAERVAAEATRQANRAAKAAEMAAERQARAADRSAQQQGRAAEQLAQREMRATASAERYKLSMRQRYFSDQQRTGERDAKASSNFRGKIGGAAASGVSAAISGVGKIAGLATAVGGGFTVADAISNEAKSSGIAADIANSGSSKEKGQFSSKQVLSSARAAATQYGLSDEDALGGLGKFTGKTGELQKGMDLLPQLAELARATGTSLQDMADAAGDAFQADTSMGAEQVMDIMRNIAAQGKLGAVEVKDLASQMAKLSSSAGKFKGKSSEMVGILGGFAQMARQQGGATSADEAATSVARLSGDLSSNKSKFEKRGIKVMDGKVFRDPREIIKDTLSQTGGDESQIGDLFGERSGRIVSGYAKTYREAESAKKGSGLAAVDKQFTDMGAVTMSKGDVTSAASKRMEEADLQFATAIQAISREIGEQLIPHLQQLVPLLRDARPHIKALLEGMIRLAEWAASNPFAAATVGLGAVIAKSMATEVAAAGLKNLLQNGFSGAGGAMAQFGIVAAAAGAAIALGVEHIKNTMDGADKRQSGQALAGGSIQDQRYALQRKIQAGTATQSDIAQAQGLLSADKSDIADMKDKRGKYEESYTEQALGGLTGSASLVSKSAEDALHIKENSRLASIERAEEEMKKFADAVAVAAAATSAANAGKGNPNDPSRSGAALADAARGGAK